MRKLAEAGLIEGKLGAGGGYRLARPAEEITVLDLLEAVEGRLDGDMNSTVSGVSHEAQKLIDGTVASAIEALRVHLDRVTLAELIAVGEA